MMRMFSWRKLVLALCVVFDTCHGFQQQQHHAAALGRLPTTGASLPSSSGHTTIERRSHFSNRNNQRSVNHPHHHVRHAVSTTTTSLSAAPAAAAAAASGLLTSVLSSPLGSITLLATIVLIHEAGHYLAARCFGIQVEEFSVGVGPKLFGFQAFGDEFNLRALPLGGYVRFPENYNVTAVQELQAAAVEQAKEERKKKNQGGAGTRFLNFLSAGAIEKRRQDEKQQQAELEQEQPWWKRFNIGNKKSNEDELEVPQVEIPYDDNPNLLQNRPWQERAVVLSGGVIFNLLLSFSIYFGQIAAGPGIPSPVFEQGVVVSSAPRSQTASEGLLRKGDVILNVNGKALTESTSPTVFESQRAINELIATIRETPSGEDIQLTILRDAGNNEKQQQQPMDIVRIKPRPMNGGTSGSPSIGVLLTPNYVKSAVLKSSNPVEAARMAAEYTTTLTKETAGGLLRFVTEAFSSKSSSSGAQVSGPIGLIRTGSDVVATKDLTAVLLFAAAISINLGVVNALPLPALDGGQLLFVLAEAVTGRKIDQRIQEGITGVAVFVLLLITLTAAVGDLSTIVVGR